MAVLLLPLLNCGGSQHAADETYFLVGMNVKLPYWQQVGAGLRKAASELKVKAEFVGPDTFDVKGQHEAFADVLKRKPSGIMVSASDPNVINADIDAAIAQGVPVITIDSDAPESRRLMFVGTDNYKAGVMGGTLAAKMLKFRGSVVVYTIPEQHNLSERLRGYKDVFENYPQMKIAEIVDVKGDPRIAFDKTTEILEKGARADAFVSLVSFAGPEISNVLARHNVTGKVVIAMDTDDRTLAGIQKGIVTATIGQKPYTMAFFGLKLLDDLHHRPLPTLKKRWYLDSFSPIPVFIDTGATLINPDNVDQFIRERNTVTGK
jgi:ribose transport system substrate-binding protein